MQGSIQNTTEQIGTITASYYEFTKVICV